MPWSAFPAARGTGVAARGTRWRPGARGGGPGHAVAARARSFRKLLLRYLVDRVLDVRREVDRAGRPDPDPGRNMGRRRADHVTAKNCRRDSRTNCKSARHEATSRCFFMRRVL